MAGEKKEKPEAASAPAKSSDDNLIAALCYIIGLVALFVLLTDKKENKFLKFHALQTIFLWVGWFVFFICWGILSFVLAILTAPLGGIGGLAWFCIPFIGLAVLLVVLLAAWKAFQGEEYEIPVLGKFARKYV
ncbi:MAG: DUF4870 domain-containing protein [Candidatus Bilamarchaeaceae archaeon]